MTHPMDSLKQTNVGKLIVVSKNHGSHFSYLFNRLVTHVTAVQVYLKWKTVVDLVDEHVWLVDIEPLGGVIVYINVKSLIIKNS